MNQATIPNGSNNPAFEQDDHTTRSTGSRTSGALYRHPTNRVLAGVCGGLADWLGWDAVVVRLLWLVLAFATSGASLLVYLLLAVVLPVGTQSSGAVKGAPVETRLHSGKPLAFLLMGLGVLWLMGNLGVLSDVTHVVFTALRLFFWPVLLILIGWKILRAMGVPLGDGEAMRSQVDQWSSRAAAWREQMRSASAEPRIPHAANPEAQNLGAPTLTRSSHDRVLLGVCGGIAARYGIDPVLVRLLWTLLTLATLGFGLLAYLLVALLLPVDKGVATASTPAGASHADPSTLQDIPIQAPKSVDF